MTGPPNQTEANDGGTGGTLQAATYKYRITFVADTGVESNPSDEFSVTLGTDNHKVTLTNLPTGPANTEARRIYRQKVEVPATAFILVGTVNDNNTREFTDRLRTAVDPAGAQDATSPNVGGTEAADSGELAARNYTYRITFISNRGTEYKPSADITAIAVAANHKVTLTNLPIGPSFIEARRIYRKIDGGTFTLVATVNNTTRTFIDLHDPFKRDPFEPVIHGGLPEAPDVKKVPETAAAATAGRGRLLSGNYNYRITFLTDTGIESEASEDVSVNVASNNRKVRLTNIPIGPDGTEARRIYRQKVEVPATPFILVGTVNDNETREFIDRLCTAVDPAGNQDATSPNVLGPGIPVPTKATVDVTIPGDNNDLRFTAVQPGDELNETTIHFVNRGGTGPATVTWNPFTKQLIFDVRDNTTANDVIALLNGPNVAGPPATTAVGAPGGTLSAGDYAYKISFVDLAGAEGNLSAPIPANGVGANNKVTLSNIPAGPEGTLARKIYRAPKDSTEFTLVGTLNGNADGTFTDWGPGAFDPGISDIARRAPPDVVVAGTRAADSGPGGQLAAGSYQYKITFLKNTGAESTMSDPVSVNVTANKNQVLLTQIPRGGADIEARRIYRTDANGSVFHLIGTLNDNEGTTFFDRGLSESTGTAPVVTETKANAIDRHGVGKLSEGAYQYKISFVTNTSVESALSAAISTGEDLSEGDRVWLAPIPTSPDSNVVARRIYRTDANGSVFHLIGTINDNVNVLFVDIVGDSTSAADTSIAPPNLAASGTLANLMGSGGQLASGTYGYRVSFLDKNGVESNASETVSVTVAVDNS